MTTIDLLSLAGGDLRRVASTGGGEYAGPCPLCGGRDRLRVWPDHPGGRGGQWWCRQCNKGGDLPALLVELGKLTPAEAGKMRRAGGATSAPAPRTAAPRHPDRLAAPGRQWQQAARTFAAACAAWLWSEAGAPALAWLRGRGLADETIRAAGLGYHPQDRTQPGPSWGQGIPVWLPRGVVIPWWISGDLWRVNIRRPQGDPKYFSVAGFTVGLYNADALTPGKPVILVEGEIDALTLGQEAGDLVVAVALGSTQGGRRPRWIAALAAAPLVLVALDADDAGDQAAAWWLRVLPNGRRWRPLWSDANAMAQEGADLRGWVRAALDGPSSPTPWEGQRVRIEDLAEFKARWGLRTVGSEWPALAACPTVFLARST